MQVKKHDIDLLDIVLFVLLRWTYSGCPIGVFKLFLRLKYYPFYETLYFPIMLSILFFYFYVILLWVLVKVLVARPKELPSMSSMLPILCVLYRKKSLKTPMGQPEYVHRRRTNNTMSKRKKPTKGQTTIHKSPACHPCCRYYVYYRWGCQVIVQKARQCTILGIVLEECTLKTSFVDLEKKEYAHCSFFQTLVAFPPALFSCLCNPYTAYIRSELSLPKKRSEMCPMYKCVMYKTTFQDGRNFLWVCNGMKVLCILFFFQIYKRGL
jgi:hypothetical protein